MERTIFGAILFLSLLGVVLAAFFGSSSAIVSSQTSQFYNITNPNITVINGPEGSGLPPLPTCEFSDNFFLNLLSGAVCIGSEIGWFVNIMLLGSPIGWLAAIMIAIGAVITILIIKTIRGN